MSAVRSTLLALASALLLVGCGDLFKPPQTHQPPDDADPGPDTQEAPGPEMSWTETFEHNYNPNYTRMALTDSGHIFFGGSQYAGPPGRPDIGAPTADNILVFDQDGNQLAKHSLGFDDDFGALREILPAGHDRVIAVGSYTTRDSGYSAYPVTYILGINAAGTFTPSKPSILFAEDGAVGAHGAVPLPNNKIYVYGVTRGSFAKPNPSGERQMFGAIIDAETLTLERRVQYEGAAIPLAATYAPTPPPGITAPEGVIYVLRQERTAADCSTRPAPCYPHIEYVSALVDLIDVATGELLVASQVMLQPNQTDYYEDIIATPSNAIYLMGAYFRINPTSGNEEPADLLITEVDIAGKEVRRVRDGGDYNDLGKRLYALHDGSLLAAGWTDGARWGAKWANQKGSGGAFVAKYSPSLEREWVHMVGEPEANWEGVAAAHKPGAGYYLGGHHLETADPSSWGNFLVRFDDLD